MKITEQTDESVTLHSDVTGARNTILGATMAALVVTVAGMVMESTLLVIIGALCVIALYGAFIFGLETLHATLDIVDGTAEVERKRRGQPVARAIVPLETILPAPDAYDPERAFMRNLHATAATRASQLLPAPAMAPTDARRVLAWAANA
ncbi:hypothetical protein [Gymnodinialimonas sp. 57CJ19]|uniref:hypothetical protein n=1 Tax=Gymnodinialimonas sp. 57CJ19 TaxID=3138498 RepID=UPI0031343A09